MVNKKQKQKLHIRTQETVVVFGMDARRLQILRDGFDPRLEPIAFDIYTGWLLTRRAQAHFAISSITVQFSVQYDLKITSVIYYMFVIM